MRVSALTDSAAAAAAVPAATAYLLLPSPPPARRSTHHTHTCIVTVTWAWIAFTDVIIIIGHRRYCAASLELRIERIENNVVSTLCLGKTN